MKEIKIGDKVRLKDLKELEECYGYALEIGEFANKVVTIKEYFSDFSSNMYCTSEIREYAIYQDMIAEIVEDDDYITYEEFKEEIEKLGFDILSDERSISVIRMDYTFVEVSKKSLGCIDASFSSFPCLGDDNRTEMLDLCMKLTKTPLDKRTREKKYYWRLKGFNNKDSYLNLIDDENSILISSEEDFSYYRTQFTEKEFMDLVEEHGFVAEAFEKVEVEND